MKPQKESSKAEQDGGALKVISENRKARFSYHIIETLEAGIVLTGPEIKSIRTSGISVQEGYIRPQGGELFLLGAHIKPYSFSQSDEYDPVRPRKLLLKHREIERLVGAVERKGMTIVVLKVYLKRGLAKLEIALAKGKNAPDKREGIRARESEREMLRGIKGKR